MNGEVYTTSPGGINVPPSPFQFAVNRKDEEIRKLKMELQAMALNVVDLESEVKQKDDMLSQKEKFISRLKLARTYLKSTYEQEIENLKPFQDQCRSQDAQIKRLQQDGEELIYQKNVIDGLENEKEELVKEKETLLERMIGLKDNLIENNYLKSLLDDQRMKIEELHTIIGQKNADIEEYRNSKELYQHQIQQLHTQHAENMELLEQRMNQSDICGEILSVVCVEKQIDELKIELDEVRASNVTEMSNLRRERDEKVKELKSELEKKDREREKDLVLLDRLVEESANTTQNLIVQMNRCDRAFSSVMPKFASLETTCIQRTAHLELENNVKSKQIERQLKEICKWKLEAQTLSRANVQLEVEMSAKNDQLGEKNSFVREMSARFESAHQRHEEQRRDVEDDVEVIRNRVHLIETQVNEERNELKDVIERLNQELRKERDAGSILALELDEIKKSFVDFENEKTFEIGGLEEEVKLLTDEKMEVEKSLENLVEFVKDLSRSADDDRVETESLLEVITLEMKLAENKLSFLEANVQQFQEREFCCVETIGKLGEQIRNYKNLQKELDERIELLERDKGNLQMETNQLTSRLGELEQLRSEESREFLVEKENLQTLIDDGICENKRLLTRFNEYEKTKNGEIEELMRVEEDLQFEKDNVVSEMHRLENCLREFAKRLETMGNERTSLLDELGVVETLKSQMLTLEQCVESADERQAELMAESERLQDVIFEKDGHIAKAEKELSALGDASAVQLAALVKEKEFLENNWASKMDEIQSKKFELEEENGALKMCIEDTEEKIANLVLELNKLRSEKSALGLEHELEMAEKMQFFRVMWETEKSALKLELESRQQESENLKESFVERLKQEEMKCKLLRQNMMTLQEESELMSVEARRKSTTVITELQHKMEVYKHHYEDQKEKISKLTRVIFKENASDVDGPNSQFNSTDSLESCVNTRPELFRPNMSAFQSGDHKVEANNKKAPQQFKFYMGADDEEEDWDLKYVKALKVGSCEVPSANDRRLTELQRRNTLCLPHLKTTYPVETQMCTAIPFEDDDFKRGKAILDEFKVSDGKYLSPMRKRGTTSRKAVADGFLCNETPKQKVRPVFRKPGSPAQAKNNMSLSKNVVKTPSSLKRLFGSRRVFKPNPRQPVAFNVGFSPLRQKSRRCLDSTPKDEQLDTSKSSGFRNKLKIFSKIQKKIKDENVLNNF